MYGSKNTKQALEIWSMVESVIPSPKFGNIRSSIKVPV